ncbi:EP1-like glycoprotein 3 [Linum perenne]
MSSFLLCLCFFFFPSTPQATVPPSARFSFSNDGDFGDYIVEYGANYRTLSIGSTPFQLCFYNTTPGQYTLALRMGTVRSEALMRWVWEANRGNPVGENATFSLGENGNLVLANSDGRIAWQSNTADKGVTGFQLLNNGNMVLRNSRGEFVWQSFDSPTDTLLVGQSLRVGAATKLTSRASIEQNQNGPYSFVLEPRDLALYFTGANRRTPSRYFSFSGAQQLFIPSGTTLQSTLQNATFSSRLRFELGVTNSFGSSTILKNPRFNTTLSYLRLEIDGNIRVYTFIIFIDSDGFEVQRWEPAITIFSEDDLWALDTKCQLPSRCGEFGVCEDSQCVACPTANGLMGWSKDCKPPAVDVNNCSGGGRKFRYFELKGIDHFMAKYTRGDAPVKKAACEEKCSKDCKCLGYFYQSDSSRCWIAYELKTMSRVANQTHLAYIKTPIA